MTIYKIDPNYKVSYTSKNHTFITGRTDKIRKDKNNTNSQFLEILINSIQSEVKPVYDRDYKGNLHQFQCHTV